MGTLQTWRKAYGAIKDSTKVGLAKVNSEYKDLDIAIVKATNHVESPPKERHIRKIFGATSVVRPRADVAYCIHALARRLAKTHNWTVALKTLIVIHRTLREGDPTFREELLNYAHRGHILQISNFKDDSSPLAWDCSAWVRTYALFLEERLECFRILKYDIEAERLTKTSQGPAKPEGAASGNYLIQYALALVLKESFKIYCAINDGIINLVDMFFEMSRHDAVKALDIYKRAGQQAENLANFYDFCKSLELARNFQFPTLRQPPPSFLTTMEEYIREAPKIGSVLNKTLEYKETNLLTYKQEDAPPPEDKPAAEPEEKPAEAEEPQPITDIQPEPILPTGDLLGLHEINPLAAELEESNALALAIIPSGDSKLSNPSGLSGIVTDPTGWELALAGGFNKLLLDSLYDDAAGRQQNAAYGGRAVVNPFEAHDPFSMSSNIAPPPNVQMALMAQQQQQFYQQQQQQMTMMPNMYQPQYSPSPMASSNPFGDPFV
ncbi:putative clathrin assembly protein [Acorus gramineus]|uniref:Clathrin assembly protein n=1 Tax=Acorus gramineus TaxID=55184 RepID=A0AAV9AWR4_ACOGR|nr:putative clathrin assembly protein [Acorus gramineus]